MALYRHMYRDLLITQPALVEVVGRLRFTDGAGAFVATGRGFTAARTGTGTFTITLDARGGVPDILGVSVIHTHSTTNQAVRVTSVVPSTGVVTFQIHVVGTATDPSINCQIFFRVTVQNNRYAG